MFLMPNFEQTRCRATSGSYPPALLAVFMDADMCHRLVILSVHPFPAAALICREFASYDRKD
jgi:hypothetical protein